jgi:hypothetical protein
MYIVQFPLIPGDSGSGVYDANHKVIAIAHAYLGLGRIPSGVSAVIGLKNSCEEIRKFL